MRRKVLLCTFAIAVSALPVAAQDMSVDEVIAKNIEAKGGREAMDSIKTIKINGKMSMANGMEAPISFEFKRPGKFRIEFNFQGMTGVQAYDGETGWQIMPFGGKTDPEEMSEDGLKQAKDQADFDGALVGYKEKGHEIEMVGKEDADGTEAYKLKVTKANGDVDYYFLDAEYFLELKVTSKRDFQGTEMESTQNFGDYKEVAGVLMAHSIDIGGGPMGPQTLTFETVEPNIELPDDRFEMPEVAAPAAADAGE